MKDNSIIVASVAGATTASYVKQFTTKNVTIKPLLGGFVAGAMLLGISIWSTEIASAFAVVLLVTSILVNGNELFGSIDRLTT